MVLGGLPEVCIRSPRYFDTRSYFVPGRVETFEAGPPSEWRYAYGGNLHIVLILRG